MDIKKIRKKLKSDGIYHIKNYMTNSLEFEKLTNKIHHITSLLSKKYNLELPMEDQDAVEKKIIELNTLNKKIGGFMNDSINASPELMELFTCERIKQLAIDFLDVKNIDLLSNNYRFRVQIPGHDKISNLPWHQDSHYNSMYNYNNSLVIWLSINDIYGESGPIVFKKGSHVYRQLPRLDHLKPNGLKAYTISEEYLSDSRFQESSIDTKKGDILLIDLNLIHRSGYNDTKDKIKLSCQARFHNSSANGFLSEYL
mgnify:CR=1 FL=1